MILHKFQKIRKAATLPEVMIVLLVVSTTMIGGVSVLAQSILELRANEIEDITNQQMIRIAETIKTPGNLLINGTNPEIQNTSYYYSIVQDGTDAEESFELQFQSNESADSNSFELNSCDSNDSGYELENFLDLSLCAQVEITPLTDPPQEYEVVVRMAYNQRGETIVKNFKTFRLIPF